MNNAGKWACDQLTDDADFAKKKILFSDEAHFDLGGFTYPSDLVHRKPAPDASKTSHCLLGILVQIVIGPFFFENEQGEAVTVNDDRYRAMFNEFLFTKIEEEAIGNIWFNRTALCATQPKLHSMF